MQDKNGNNAEITKNELDSITCLKNKKIIFDKKNERQEEAMLKFFKSEILKEKIIPSNIIINEEEEIQKEQENCVYCRQSLYKDSISKSLGVLSNKT